MSRIRLNLEAETLSATKRLHCRGAIEPILKKKHEKSKKGLY